MKTLILNLFLCFVIVVGGTYLLQPTPAMAQTTCTGGCTGCLGSECDKSEGTECGVIERQSDGKLIVCFKEGSNSDPGEN